MKNRYVREIRRIATNFSLRNAPTGYNIDSKSLIFKIICDLKKRKLVVYNKIDGQFLFVSPTDTLKTFFKKDETKNKIVPVPILNKNLVWKNHTENYSINSPAIVAA
jgi:hypothetical protein